MQTAVEYLVHHLQAPCKGIPSHIIDQAKEREKNHAMSFHLWMKENDIIDNAERFFHYSGEDMYNEFLKETYNRL